MAKKKRKLKIPTDRVHLATLNNDGYDIAVNQSNLDFMLIATVRYCLWRQTYAVEWGADLVKCYWSFITDSSKKVILIDITDALIQAKDDGNTVGAKIDHDVWVNLKYWINSQNTN